MNTRMLPLALAVALAGCDGTIVINGLVPKLAHSAGPTPAATPSATGTPVIGFEPPASARPSAPLPSMSPTAFGAGSALQIVRQGLRGQPTFEIDITAQGQATYTSPGGPSVGPKLLQADVVARLFGDASIPLPTPGLIECNAMRADFTQVRYAGRVYSDQICGGFWPAPLAADVAQIEAALGLSNVVPTPSPSASASGTLQGAAPFHLNASTGGVYVSDDKLLTAVFPPGAVSQDTDVRIVRVVTGGLANSDTFLNGIRFQWDLGGATATPGATITITAKADDRLLPALTARYPNFTFERYNLSKDAQGNINLTMRYPFPPNPPMAFDPAGHMLPESHAIPGDPDPQHVEISDDFQGPAITPVPTPTPNAVALDISGDWQAGTTGEPPPGPVQAPKQCFVQPSFTLQEQGSQITGSVPRPITGAAFNGPQTSISGTIDGDHVKLTFTTSPGQNFGPQVGGDAAAVQTMTFVDLVYDPKSQHLLGQQTAAGTNATQPYWAARWLPNGLTFQDCPPPP